jgi:hypothetical protein
MTDSSGFQTRTIFSAQSPTIINSFGVQLILLPFNNKHRDFPLVRVSVRLSAVSVASGKRQMQGCGAEHLAAFGVRRSRSAARAHAGSRVVLAHWSTLATPACCRSSNTSAAAYTPYTPVHHAPEGSPWLLSLALEAFEIGPIWNNLFQPRFESNLVFFPPLAFIGTTEQKTVPFGDSTAAASYSTARTTRCTSSRLPLLQRVPSHRAPRLPFHRRALRSGKETAVAWRTSTTRRRILIA